MGLVKNLENPFSIESSPKDFQWWNQTFESIVQPVLEAFEKGKLVQSLDREEFPRKYRMKYASLEAMARVLYPYLQIRREPKFSQELIHALENALIEGNPDAFNWDKGDQPLVDAAILTDGLLQNPDVFESQFSEKIRSGFISGWRKSLSIKAYDSNWLLFAAMVEAALQK